jgi:mRNA interferase MazF
VNRGDVYRLPPPRRARGHEQHGPRLAVVLRADEFSSLSTTVIAPTSASAVAATYRPTVSVAGVTTRVLTEHLRAVDTRRLGKRVGRLTWEEMAEVERALRLLLGL